MITHDELFKQLMDNLHSLEENKEYLISEKAWDRYNQARKSHGYDELDRKEYKVRVTSNQGLYVGKTCVATDFTEFSSMEDFTLSFTFAFTLTHAFAFTLTFTEFEPVEETCDGEIVQIKGHKYKLTLIS